MMPSTNRYKINAPPGIWHSCLTLIQCNCAEIIAGANEESDINEWTAKSVPSMPIIFMVAAVSSTADDKLLFSYVY